MKTAIKVIIIIVVLVFGKHTRLLNHVPKGKSLWQGGMETPLTPYIFLYYKTI